MFFKRLSRSRSNSQSYVDNYQSPHDSKTNSASYEDKYAPEKYDDNTQRPDSSRDSNPPNKEPNMYARQGQPTEASGAQYASPPVSAGAARGGGTTNGYAGGYDAPASSAPAKSEPAPDLLLQAFNMALRPYTDKVGDLESELADLRAYIEQLEAQRSDVHAWIDKRGLRPGELSVCSNAVCLTLMIGRCAAQHSAPDGQRVTPKLSHPRRLDPQRPA